VTLGEWRAVLWRLRTAGRPRFLRAPLDFPSGIRILKGDERTLTAALSRNQGGQNPPAGGRGGR